MINEKLTLIMLGFSVNPELIYRDIGIPVVLTEVRKFFINMTTNIGSIHNPNLDIPSLIHFFNIGWL